MKQGFSLVETLVAVSVVVFSVLSPVTLTIFSLKSSSFSKNTLIAGNLAQEGVELVRARSKNNTLDGQNWLNGIQGICSGSPNGCGIDAYDLNPDPCAANNCILQFDGAYNHGSGQDTIFKRVIKLNEIQADIEAKVTVEVFWTERFGTQKVIVEENMFNWQ